MEDEPLLQQVTLIQEAGKFVIEGDLTRKLQTYWVKAKRQKGFLLEPGWKMPLHRFWME